MPYPHNWQIINQLGEGFTPTTIAWLSEMEGGGTQYIPPGQNPPTVLTKQGDVQVSGGAVNNPDSSLVFPTVNGNTYEFLCYLFYKMSGGTPQITVGCGEDSTVRGQWIGWGTAVGSVSCQSTQRPTIVSYTSSTTGGVAILHGGHVGGGGTFAICWGKDSAAGTVTLLKGSYLMFRDTTYKPAP